MTLKEMFLNPDNPDVISPRSDIHCNELFPMFPLLMFMQQAAVYGFYLDRSKTPWALDKYAINSHGVKIPSIPYRPLKNISEKELANILEEMYNYCLEKKIFHVYCITMKNNSTILHAVTGMQHMYDDWVVASPNIDRVTTVGDYKYLKINREKVNIWKEMVN